MWNYHMQVMQIVIYKHTYLKLLFCKYFVPNHQSQFPQKKLGIHKQHNISAEFSALMPA